MLYLAAGAAGVLVHPLIGSVVFLLLPAYYAFTSHGHDQQPAILHRRTPSDNTNSAR
ncbi:hypothetical protein [Microbacterium trichothecenolyticum]|uniref:Uncharacterized protein n=1 Tax=Microbacterium trichothecenolyticum TaxID=69370 RepID=A0A0M2HHA4_MICTR|nr:hypothetical protein [Microbacterium trichothecenolyticum]KJL44140.1 hypothetical protein RS82_01103 [Microbacterium trichothecenolyticum]